MDIGPREPGTRPRTNDEAWEFVDIVLDDLIPWVRSRIKHVRDSIGTEARREEMVLTSVLNMLGFKP